MPDELMPTPDILKDHLPLLAPGSSAVKKWREEICGILKKEGEKLLIIVGPCSIHDLAGAVEYLERLASLAGHVQERLLLVVRLFVEKPRTSCGWPGLIHDPHLDGSYATAQGLALARELFLHAITLGLPIATELLSPFTFPYLSDLISWGSVGARTVSSPIHRQLASLAPFPVGFKNPPGGDIDEAITAAYVASHPHTFFGIDGAGCTTLHRSPGNSTPHIVLRGSKSAPNSSPAEVKEASEKLQASGFSTGIIVDCAHDNGRRRLDRQALLFEEVIERIAEGEDTIAGLMCESYLEEGKQSLSSSFCTPSARCSITDPCLGWEMTERLIEHAYALAEHRTLCCGT